MKLREYCKQKVSITSLKAPLYMVKHKFTDSSMRKYWNLRNIADLCLKNGAYPFYIYTILTSLNSVISSDDRQSPEALPELSSQDLFYWLLCILVVYFHVKNKQITKWNSLI